MEDQKTTSLAAYILAGSLIDLSILDFSCVNVRMVNLASGVLKEISQEFTPLYESYFALEKVIKKDAKKIQDVHTSIHVLLPIDFSQQVSESTLQACINVLKLLFPSDLEVHTVAKFQVYQNHKTEWIHSSSYHFYTSGAEPYDNYLGYPIDKEIGEINEFIARFFTGRSREACPGLR